MKKNKYGDCSSNDNDRMHRHCTFHVPMLTLVVQSCSLVVSSGIFFGQPRDERDNKGGVCGCNATFQTAIKLHIIIIQQIVIKQIGR